MVERLWITPDLFRGGSVRGSGYEQENEKRLGKETWKGNPEKRLRKRPRKRLRGARDWELTDGMTGKSLEMEVQEMTGSPEDEEEERTVRMRWTRPWGMPKVECDEGPGKERGRDIVRREGVEGC